MPAQRGPVSVAGQGRQIGSPGASQRLRIELREADFEVALEAAAPTVAAYRELATLAAQPGHVLLALAGGGGFIVEQLGDRLATLVGELRERRARQLLADRLIELPADERLEAAEYRVDDEHGATLLAFHAWGAALAPYDERRSWRLVRRADVSSVEADPRAGRLRIDFAPRTGAPPGPALELLGLGAAVDRQRLRWAGLRERALGDARAMIGALLPDLAGAARATAAELLVDGRPATPDQLGEAWGQLESAVLGEPTFAAAYRLLAERGGSSWLALAPARPSEVAATGSFDRAAAPPAPVAWYFVSLPANLVAMEIVTGGAHATYLFRVLPRADFRGQPPTELGEAATAAVHDVSEALLDSRFLREPIYLPDDRLAEPRHARYRLAVAALPSLQAARARFVGRLIHRDESGWQAGLNDAIAWHAGARAEDARWPGTATDTDATMDDQPTETT